MGIAEIIASVDREIALLEQARALLIGSSTGKRPVGRPRKSAAQAVKPKAEKKKRNLSPEGRKRIADAVKRRWAAQRKAEGK